ncbi:teichoic acid D-Ala incorporation-associated protein DltX [Sporolactobacillus kofuensis]|uniref:Teichoic acid D-Ala incorporation-associated protein DltX n=1 Tax=Sporolactobacillus kofuensis TaxID=269672 RepID=A0ABW1WFE1_9BACL|nr:teichoic acid D-Ala incorporation-associated protein DltX [Sporolactobacillus kofuensis]MCO7175435.1 teichoic acid D-Ala incorporation-associated protein DltX [Sporolactobacillus kofuensis]
MKLIKFGRTNPALFWTVRTLFYTAILFGLVIIYGFSAAHTGTFIYSDF